MTTKQVEQAIGELLMYAPLVITAALCGMAMPVVLAMVTFFIFKWPYKAAPFHLDCTRQCVALSYSTFLCIGVLYLGLASLTPFLKNQPMIAILAAIGLTWLTANAGEWQAGYYANTKTVEYYNLSRRNRAKETLLTLPPQHIDYALLADYAAGETLEILADKYNMSFSTVNRRINALTQK